MTTYRFFPPCLPPRPKPTPLPPFVSHPSQTHSGFPPQETCSASDLQLPRPNPQESLWSRVGGRDGSPSSLPTAPPHLLIQSGSSPRLLTSGGGG
ncbi:hypothetical protein K456DRAFT_965832 [Colletotrichum gloeosporioides 23]|nr:hypothetical protein K456DRAFT_965832 [Colletotrichum gloeosporioides 23]